MADYWQHHFCQPQATSVPPPPQVFVRRKPETKASYCETTRLATSLVVSQARLPALACETTGFGLTANSKRA